MKPIESVILVHGIWAHGVTMVMMKYRLQKEYGLDVHLFNYPSVTGTLDDNARRLSDFIHDLGLDATHIIGHSLGGVIALRMYAIDEDAVPGRLVCMGSPLTGSRAAEFLSTQNWAEPILGESLPAGVVHEAANEWASHVCEQRDVGSIAGTTPMGVGRLITSFDGDNDGTVAVAETRLEGAKDHIRLPVSHTNMLLSSDVVDQAVAFLKRGRFLRDS
ncbi:MAG: alpha/beta fold hydrolase [Woeseiaceae bacterium]|nr:alpha/beta fold hydrolase [Woeseiaceae bacterium]